MKIETKRDRRTRIHWRLRKRIEGSAERPRLSVFRSEAHVYAQAIDDLDGTTIVAASSVEPAVRARFAEGARSNNTGGARVVGAVVAERLLERGVTAVVFDRGGFLYHGRVKAVADAAREAGLKF